MQVIIVHYASLTCNSMQPQHTLQSTYYQFYCMKDLELHLKFIHPCERYTQVPYEEGCDFQIDWHTEQLYLKNIHLHTILVNLSQRVEEFCVKVSSRLIFLQPNDESWNCAI